MYKGNSDQLFKLYSDYRRELILKVINNFTEAIPWFTTYVFQSPFQLSRLLFEVVLML